MLLEGRVGETFDAAVLDVDEKRPLGTVAIDDPAVRARCTGGLPLGERVGVRLTVADPQARRGRRGRRR